jgi:GGDEF domain-containing protein
MHPGRSGCGAMKLQGTIDYYAWKTVPADTQGDPQPVNDSFAHSSARMHRFLLWFRDPGVKRDYQIETAIIQRDQALHDHLTNLPNRYQMEQRLDQAIARARRHGPSGPGKVIHPHVVAVENIPVA